MTPKQIELLKRCIRAVRTREQAIREGDDQLGRMDTELIEVGRISGVDNRTAQSLCDLGLITTDMPSWTNEHTNTHVRLLRLDEIEQQEKEEQQ